MMSGFDSKLTPEIEIQQIVSVLNDNVDAYLIQNYNSFINLIHVDYYEIMDFFSNGIKDTLGSKSLDENEDIRRLYTIFKYEFNSIFKKLEIGQMNLELIAIQILKDKTITDKTVILKKYEKIYKELVDDTISEMIMNIENWSKYVMVNIETIKKYNQEDATKIQELLNKVAEDINKKQLKTIPIAKPIKCTIVRAEARQIREDDDMFPFAESNIANTKNKYRLNCHLFVYPSANTKPTLFGGKKTKKRKSKNTKKKIRNKRKNQSKKNK